MLAGMPNIPGLVAPTTLANVGLSLGGAALINAVFGKKWGVYNEFGIPIVLADSFISMSYDAAASISKYPVEQGSFASYNKVNTPSMATVTLAKGGNSVEERQVFFTQLEALLKSTISFYIITPEYVFMKYQLIGINKTRTAQNGATMLTVNLDLEEVLEAKVDYDLEEVKQPSDSNTVDGGAKTSTQRTSILSDIFGGS